MEKVLNHNIFHDIVVITSILLVMDFWSYLPFLRGEFGTLDFVLHSLLLLIYFFTILSNYHIFSNQLSQIDKIVLWTIITIFIGVIPSYIEYNQPIIESIRACLRLTHGLFLYFVLRCWRFDSNRLMQIITIISLIWVLLEIGQQFTYPQFFFSGRYILCGFIEVRMNLYRFYIWGVDFVMIAYAYWLYRMFNNKSYAKIPYVFFNALIFMAGLLCYCSRKHIYAVLLAFFYLFLRQTNKRLFGFIWLIVIMLILSSFYDDFKMMNDDAVEAQGEGEDFVRWIAAKYFIFDFSTSPLYPLWGVGLEVSNSSLGYFLEKLASIKIYQADCGIIGYYSKFGLLGVFPILWYIYFFIKNRSEINLWLHGFFIMKLLLIVFDFWAIWDVGMCAYAVFLYFLQCDLKTSKLL